MYRDGSTALDEHDRAVGAILIGEALIDACDRAWERSRDEVQTPPAERWRAIAEIHDTFPEIWRHLDRARRVLAQRGANTQAYDEMRPHARRAATNPGLDGERSVDSAALDDAKRAAAELKLAVPGAEWGAIEQRTQGLLKLPLGRRRRHRMIVAGVMSAVALAAATWVAAIVPEHKPDPRAVMASELDLISQQRRLKIEMLHAGIGDRCIPTDARELIKLLVMDGRTGDARAFGDSYSARCGEDPVVTRWAAAPRPGH